LETFLHLQPVDRRVRYTFKRIKISGPRPFDFDGRLWKSGEK
jgi:hypothetical protein